MQAEDQRLARELARLAAVEVRTFGQQDVETGRLVVRGHGAAAGSAVDGEGAPALAPVVRALRVCLSLGTRPTVDGTDPLLEANRTITMDNGATVVGTWEVIGNYLHVEYYDGPDTWSTALASTWRRKPASSTT